MAKLREDTKRNGGLREIEPGDPRFWIPETFSGSFKDMLPYIRKYPAAMETASMRALRLIRRLGKNNSNTIHARQLYGRETLNCWHAFDEFYGIEPTIDEFVNILAAAAMNTEFAYQVIFLQGGPSTAKSAVANKIKQLFVEAEPALQIARSNIRCHPSAGFSMIPVLAGMMARSGRDVEVFDNRAQIMKALDLDQDGALRFRFDSQRVFEKNRFEPTFENMCRLRSGEDFTTVLVDAFGLSRSVRAITGFPDMAVYEPFFRGLKGGEDPIAMLRDLEISNFRFMHGDTGAVGIAEVKETQPYKFDLSEVIGDEDLRMAFQRHVNAEEMIRMIGAYCVANRGVLNWVEMAKAAIEAIRSILDLTQDRRARYSAPFGTRTWIADILFMAQTNTEEYFNLVKKEGNAPFKDRFGRIDVLQPFRSDAIRKTIDKQWMRAECGNPDSDDHIRRDPLITELGAIFLSGGRIKLPENFPLKLMQVVDALGGEYYLPTEQGSRASASEILADLGPLQGRDGPTLRFEDKIIGAMAGSALLNDRGYILSRDLFGELDRILDVERRWAGETPWLDSEKEPPTSDLGKLHMFLKGPLAKRRKRRMAQMVRAALKIAMTPNEEGSDMESDLRQVYGNKYVSIIQRLQRDPGKVPESDRSFANKVDTFIGIPSSGREEARKLVLEQLKSQLRAKADAHTMDMIESGQIEAGEDADFPLDMFPPLKKAIDKMIASEIEPEVALRLLGAAGSKERKGGLDVMERVFGVTREMAEDIFDEVKNFNYLKEMGDDLEDYK
jgi:hypothetical protein